MLKFSSLLTSRCFERPSDFQLLQVSNAGGNAAGGVARFTTSLISGCTK